MNTRKKIIISTLLIIIIVSFLIPSTLKMPVQGATQSDYNPKSFWFYPWGQSITHKGVDIFAKKGTLINASTFGLVLFSGKIRVGGNVILIIDAKWRLHYYAHLEHLNTASFSFVNTNSTIGTVGATGNAAGKSPHLHYSVLTIIPYVWRIDSDKQGWKKIFYLNPMEYFEH